MGSTGGSNGWMAGGMPQSAPQPAHQQPRQPQQHPQQSQSQQSQQTQSRGDEMGFQVRQMGLKIHYSFDKENKENCLARWPQLLQIQTIPVDERNWIGVIDLKTCLQAVAQCSPELVGQAQHDYTVYATDYSEPDTPLVGQGMLSWGLEGHNEDHKVLTGRVTRNLLAVFGKGVPEILEVKLKLTAVPKMQRADSVSMARTDSQNHAPRGAPTPTDTTEWNSFIQSNPSLGRTAGVAAVPSPTLAPSVPYHTNDARPYPAASSRPGSVGPPLQANAFAPATFNSGAAPSPAAAPSPPAPVEQQPEKPAPAPKVARPRSRATGKPRGRPRKRGVADGNTSAAEEQITDADEGPKRKRAKPVQTEYPDKAPLDSAPDSLRIAASTSGALRAMRPILAAGPDPATSHLAEGPRAPTPVPQAAAPRQRKKAAPKPRRESLASFDGGQTGIQNGIYADSQMQMSQGHDARSPTESIAPSAYTPEDSPADLGSSPPIPRPTAYSMQSSPAPSSPILPSFQKPVDSGFMSGGMDVQYDDEDLLDSFALQPTYEELPLQVQALPPPQPPKPAPRKKSQPAKQSQPSESNYSFQIMNPGPPELLPAKSIYNPPPARRPSIKAANGQEMPPMKRANTEPIPRPEAEDIPASAPPAAQTPQALSQTPLPIDDPFLAGMGEQTMTAPPISAPESQVAVATKPAESQEPEPIIPAQPVMETTEQASTDTQQLPAPAPLPLPPPPPRPLARAKSAGASLPAVPASDPPVAIPLPITLPQVPFSEAPCPPSDAMEPPNVGRNKNLVKKQTIKDRLEKAIQSGEMPPFCQNCGAIETPTWRKMWAQEHTGQPAFYEFSEKPGLVTAIDVLHRTEDGVIDKYRLVKKTLGNYEDKSKWMELLLCNPCGIWLGKFKTHRPADRWDLDKTRLNQSRRKRGESKASNTSRPKKARPSTAQPTSEAYMTTDPAGPMDFHSPEDEEAATQMTNADMSQDFQSGSNQGPAEHGAKARQGFESTHSRASGTAASPIPIEDDMGGTRRLLFPSPRKDGLPQVLSDVSTNVVKPTAGKLVRNSLVAPVNDNKENVNAPIPPATPALCKDEMRDLFGTPPARPSTPPPKAANSSSAGPFKTPTRQTPSHRPITRSISKSIRSVRTIPPSPSQALMLLQRTPTRTPRSAVASKLLGAITPSRQHPHAHFSADNGASIFDTPMTATLNQLLSEAHDFTVGSPAHNLASLDLEMGMNLNMSMSQMNNLPNLESEGAHDFHNIDFSTYLNSTDLAMPSSPPLLGRANSGASLGAAMSEDPAMWARLSEALAADES